MTGKWKRTFSQPGAAAGRLAEHRGASAAHDNRLAVAEHGRDVEATLALDVHEEGVRRLNKSLELVLALLELSRLVQEVNVVRENLSVRKRVRRVSTIIPQKRSNRFHLNVGRSVASIRIRSPFHHAPCSWPRDAAACPPPPPPPSSHSRRRDGRHQTRPSYPNASSACHFGIAVHTNETTTLPPCHGAKRTSNRQRIIRPPSFPTILRGPRTLFLYPLPAKQRPTNHTIAHGAILSLIRSAFHPRVHESTYHCCCLSLCCCYLLSSAVAPLSLFPY